MNTASDDYLKLERLIERACREQPPRRAPQTLSRNVRAELLRRAALPWWHKSFSHWPGLVRTVFVLACSVVVLASLSVTVWSGAERAAERLVAPIGQTWSHIHELRAWASFADSLLHYIVAAVTQTIPSRWLDAGFIGLSALYGMLGGLGATGYRILYATRNSA